MAKLQELNPFAKREAHSDSSIVLYKILTFVTFLLVHIVNIHFAWNAPAGSSNRTIWGQNAAHPTPFSLNHVIVDIYWVVVLFLQIGYMYHLWVGDHVAAAANVGSHFIANNLLMFGFVMLWVHGEFLIAEILLILNFGNLTSLYFRHPTGPLLVHIPVVTGPLAWNFVAIFWCGAAMVGAHGLAARIVANVFVWGWLAYGAFFLLAYKDWTMGLALSVLSASLGVHQFLLKIVALQWIFAFAIMGTLFVLSVPLALAQLTGREVDFKRHTVVPVEDTERQPLLNGE